jgi:hypothetical protein
MNASADPPLVFKDIAAAIQQLEAQIENGRQLLQQTHPEPGRFARWNRENEAVLIQVYGRKSPNVTTITRSAGNTPVWLGMPLEVRNRYHRSAMENRVRKMEGCVKALRRKAARADF